MRVEAAELTQFARALLVAGGLAEQPAGDVAEVLVEGDLLGYHTHGVGLLPAYLRALREGGMEKSGVPDVISDRGTALTWDGRRLPGAFLVRRAIDEACARLDRDGFPIVTVVIRRSHHIGCLQAYLAPVAAIGRMILLTSSDPAFRGVVPPGAIEPWLSPNPLAAGIPTDDEPILIDISLSSTAFARCRRAARDGTSLPGPWLVDGAGQPTADPRAFVERREGGMLPLGGIDLGYKGFALAIIVEALTGALAGFGRADGVDEWCGSVFLQIIDPAAFGGREAFAREMGFVAQSCRSAAVPPGAPPVRVPGDGARERRAAQLRDGVRLRTDDWAALLESADALHLEAPQPRQPNS